MRPASTTRARASRPTRPAFTLVEVVFALGLLAVTVVIVLALQGAIHQSISRIVDRDTAAGLADGIEIELRHVRDTPGEGSQAEKLGRLASLLPACDDSRSLRLVASHDGSRMSLESKVDEPNVGVPVNERYFLIEVRQQPAPLAYSPGAGFVAVAAVVKWPYRLQRPRNSDLPELADTEPMRSLMLGFALTP